LQDPLSEYIGYQPVDISTLDAVAAFFPMLFGILSVATDDLTKWTKVLLCNSLLALGKGLIGWITVVPDSAGWARCRERLGEDGVEWMRQERSSWDILALDEGLTEVGHLRWCGDMMWSGHTYFTCLYALGTYELAKIAVREFTVRQQALVCGIIALVGVLEQCIEIYFVLLNRFHYTSDIVMAIVMTFLFYTSGSIAVAAKQWARFLVTWPQCMECADSSRFTIYKEDDEGDHRQGLRYWPWALRSSGSVFIPPCFSPLCCKSMRQHIFHDEDIFNLMMLARHADPENFREEDFDEILAELGISPSIFQIPGGVVTRNEKWFARTVHDFATEVSSLPLPASDMQESELLPALRKIMEENLQALKAQEDSGQMSAMVLHRALRNNQRLQEDMQLDFYE